MPVSIQSLVEEKNPSWNESEVSEDARFNEAMQVVGDIFTRKLLYLHSAWMPCRDQVEQAIADRYTVRFFILRSLLLLMFSIMKADVF